MHWNHKEPSIKYCKYGISGIHNCGTISPTSGGNIWCVHGVWPTSLAFFQISTKGCDFWRCVWSFLLMPSSFCLLSTTVRRYRTRVWLNCSSRSLMVLPLNVRVSKSRWREGVAWTSVCVWSWDLYKCLKIVCHFCTTNYKSTVISLLLIIAVLTNLYLPEVFFFVPLH